MSGVSGYVIKALIAVLVIQVLAWLIDPVRYPLPFLQDRPAADKAAPDVKWKFVD